MFHLHIWGYHAKVHVPPPKERKLGSKTVYCVFLGYPFHSTTYIFLVVHFEVPDLDVNTIKES
jgi:hypothetical protein